MRSIRVHCPQILLSLRKIEIKGSRLLNLRRLRSSKNFEIFQSLGALGSAPSVAISLRLRLRFSDAGERTAASLCGPPKVCSPPEALRFLGRRSQGKIRDLSGKERPHCSLAIAVELATEAFAKEKHGDLRTQEARWNGPYVRGFRIWTPIYQVLPMSRARTYTPTKKIHLTEASSHTCLTIPYIEELWGNLLAVHHVKRLISIQINRCESQPPPTRQSVKNITHKWIKPNDWFCKNYEFTYNSLKMSLCPEDLEGKHCLKF